MNKPLALIDSMRFRSLPLSLAGVLLGLMLAASEYRISITVAVLVVTTTVLLQILSNMSNELGDSLSGVDRGDRDGPEYSLYKGALTAGEMKVAIVVIAVLCVISGLSMIYCSFGTLFCMDSICLMILGAAAIYGAVKYTLGRNPYGYRGLGDISVFTFFGIVAVCGSYFVAAHTFGSWLNLLPAAAIGMFSVGVLNVNNIRDMRTDKGYKVTLPLKMGPKWARIYHTSLIVGGWILLIAFNILKSRGQRYDLYAWHLPLAVWHYMFVVTLPLFVCHLYGVWTRDGKALDPMLPQLVLSTFLLCLLMGIGYVACWL